MQPLVQVKDLRALGLLIAGYLATSLVPRSYDARAIPVLAHLLTRLMPNRITERAADMKAALGEGDRQDGRLVDAREYARQRLEDRWLRGRNLHRRPALVKSVVTGLEHYQLGLDSGKGVILWRGRFCDAPAVNASLWRAGVKASHLSLDRHGSTASQLGIAVVSPLWARSEARWLKRRIVMRTDGGFEYIHDLLDVLEGNGTLSIFAEGTHTSRAPVTTTLFGIETAIPPGAPAFAHRTGAALLPVFAASPAPLQYHITIGSPIEIDPAIDRRRYVQLASEEFTGRLEDAIGRSPASWTRWPDLHEELTA